MTSIICACGKQVEHLRALLEHWKAEHGGQALKPRLLLRGKKVEMFRRGAKP